MPESPLIVIHMSELKEWLNRDIGKEKRPKGPKPVLEHICQDESLYSNWDTDDDTDDAIDAERQKTTLHKIVFIAVCFVSIVLASGLIVTYGEYPIPFKDVYGIIWNRIVDGVPSDPLEYLRDYVVCKLRLPRVIVAIIGGFGLAVAGTVMQSTLKNPMADSYTTGVSSGAAFGATLSMVTGITILSTETGMLFNAFIFSLAPTFMILTITRFKKVSATSMILAGLAVMYIFNACTTTLKLWADPDALSSIYRWQVGTLNNMLWSDVPIMLIITVIGSIAIMLLSNKINILSSGDETAKSLGIDAQKLRVICLVIVSLITASIVCHTGTIGFVGLIAPHIARIFIGSDNRYLIPAAGAFGAFLMMVSDIIGRAILAPSVLEVGVVTAFIGGPMFLYLIIKQKKEVL